MNSEYTAYVRKKDEVTIEEGFLLLGIRVIIPERFRSEVRSELQVKHPE